MQPYYSLPSKDASGRYIPAAARPGVSFAAPRPELGLGSAYPVPRPVAPVATMATVDPALAAKCLRIAQGVALGGRLVMPYWRGGKVVSGYCRCVPVSADV